MNDPPPKTSRARDACLVAFALLLPTGVTLLYFVLAADWPTAIQRAVYLTGKTVQFTLPLAWVLLVQRRRLARPLVSTAGLWENVLFGGLVLVSMLVLYHGWLKPAGLLAPSGDAAAAIFGKLRGCGIDTPWKYAALGVFYCLLHSALEEYYWRWFVFGQLRRLTSVRAAGLLSSVGFTLHHVFILGTYFGYDSILTWLGSLGVLVGGVFWSWSYHRQDSLRGPWLSHLMIDAAIFLVGWDLTRQWLAP